MSRALLPRISSTASTPSLAGLAKYAGAQPPANLVIAFQAIAASVEQAKQAAEDPRPAAAAAAADAGSGSLRSLRASVAAAGTSNAALQLSPDARYEIDFRLAQKEPQFEEALLLTHGIRLEALADDGTVIVGQNVKVSTLAGNNGTADVTLKSVSLAGFSRLPTTREQRDGVRAGRRLHCNRPGGLVRFDAPRCAGRPFDSVLDAAQ